MRLILIVISLTIASISTSAQIGFTGAYFNQSLPEWEAAILGIRNNQSFLKTGYSGEIDYRLTPFENYRVELLPSLTYNTSSSSIPDFSETFDLNQYEFNLKTNIYVLSLEADCDCPTFSREAGILEKGFFIQIAPGLSYFQSKAESQTVIAEGSGLNFKIGLGLGVEIGLSDFITLTPLVKYNRYFNVEWTDLKSNYDFLGTRDTTGGNETTNINQFYGGLRLGIRFNR